MRASIITGCLMTAFAVAVASPFSRASAADLDGEAYVDPPYDESYSSGDSYNDDDRYEAPDRYSSARPAEDYRYRDSYEGRDGAQPLPGSIKDGYPVPMPAPRASAPPPEPYYGERRPARVERYGTCLDRWEVKQQLRREGWTALQPIGGSDGVMRFYARRFDSSSDFRLRVDRCSGHVIAARPDTRRFARDWRWQRDW
jgi:hypothetical protein